MDPLERRIELHHGKLTEVSVFPAYEEDRAIRIDFWGDTVEAIREIDPLRGQTLRKLKKITVYPASHYVTTDLTRRRALASIEADMRAFVPALLDRPKEEITHALEMLVRAYDPCISCAVH